MLSRWALLLPALGAMAIAQGISACASEDASTLDATRGVDASTTVTEGICPDVAPETDAVCLLPEGTTCAFGACGTPVAVCSRGTWQYGGNPPGPPCPESPPASESACPRCWPVTQTCPYGSDDCSQPDASVNRTIASCSNGAWSLAFYPCADASTDVQGDGSADR